METTVFVVQILMWVLCPVLVGLILLQGAAGDISSSFGGGGQLDASLGVGAHRKMAKFTGFLAFLFFVMVLILAYPHRGSFRDAKANPQKPAATQQQTPTETAKPPVAPPAAEAPKADPAQPAVVPAQPEAAKPEAAPPVVVPAQPEAAKPAEPAPPVVAP